MGACLSSKGQNPQAASEANNSAMIDAMIKEDRQRQRKEVKILLLGAGESGKSTVLKQMRLMHNAGFTRDERNTWRSVVFWNVLQSMQFLLESLEAEERKEIKKRKKAKKRRLKAVGAAAAAAVAAASSSSNRDLDSDIEELDEQDLLAAQMRAADEATMKCIEEMSGGLEWVEEEHFRQEWQTIHRLRDALLQPVHSAAFPPTPFTISHPFDSTLSQTLNEKTQNDPMAAVLSKALTDTTGTGGSCLPPEMLEPLRSLWQSPKVQQIYEQGNKYALHDNMSYYFDDLDRFFHPHYVPSDQDILCCRKKTAGIVETIFTIPPLTFRVFDVGGQRSERKKWIHCFENVTSVLFMVAISCYDQYLSEDRDVNQMHESLMLFDNIVNAKWFVRSTFILFLNKCDLFKDKLRYCPLGDKFLDYQSPNEELWQKIKETKHALVSSKGQEVAALPSRKENGVVSVPNSPTTPPRKDSLSASTPTSPTSPTVSLFDSRKDSISTAQSSTLHNSMTTSLSSTSSSEAQKPPAVLNATVPDLERQIDVQKEYVAATTYFVKKFRKLSRQKDRILYVHLTTAVKSDLVRPILESIMDTIMQNNLRSIGMIE